MKITIELSESETVKDINNISFANAIANHMVEHNISYLKEKPIIPEPHRFLSAKTVAKILTAQSNYIETTYNSLNGGDNGKEI